MSSSQQPTSIAATASPNDSSSPLISSDQRKDIQQEQQQQQQQTAGSRDDKDPKSSKRWLFNLGKKKDEKQVMTSTSTQPTSAPMRSPSPSDQRPSNTTPTPAQPIPISAARIIPPPISAGGMASSPSRMRSSSPRMLSPASSEIFERNVQEPVPMTTLGGELSPAHIPSHVITEDHIPPALDASAQTITTENLNPDDVEIVMSTSHQPAGASVPESAMSPDLPLLNTPLAPQRSLEESEPSSSLHQSGIMPGLDEDSASNYGQLDPTDVKRLSFISFKDIVQSEHNQMAASSVLGEPTSRDGGMQSSSMEQHRSASPMRSPRSPASTYSHSMSGGLTTPPPPGVNINSPTLNPEQSPVRSVAGLGTPSGSHHGELTIQTMSQALRKTASGDLSTVRSAGMSPVSEETTLPEPPRSQLNM